MPEKFASFPLGVVVERRAVDNPWIDYVWRPVAVIPGAPPLDTKGEWPVLAEGEGWVRYNAGTVEMELFPKETEAYRVNLSQEPPKVYVVLRRDEEGEGNRGLFVVLATASPYEAQDYLDSGDEIVEAVAMPEGLIAFVQDYIDTFHVDEPFYKRKRKRYDPDAAGFGKRGPAASDGSQ